MNKENKIAMRSQVHGYMNMGDGENEKWERLGQGWKKFSENPNAQTESVQYIDSDSETTDTVSYSNQIAFEYDLMYTENSIKKVYDIAKQEKVGDEALVDILTVDAFEETSGMEEVTAYRRKSSVAVSSLDGTKKMTMSGNLNAYGNTTIGKFNLKTLKFTPDTEKEVTE
ncbi:MAG: hypothetical protein NC078_04725 [Ruminococcus sp.]|nr:hypothetical protein [Ruminococcus sp.]